MIFKRGNPSELKGDIERFDLRLGWFVLKLLNLLKIWNVDLHGQR